MYLFCIEAYIYTYFYFVVVYAFFRSIQIAFSAFRKYWLELLCISAHVAPHSHPLHYSKTLIGYLLNGVYASNWPP